ncbi:hypothetical protein DFJ74DRAFT_388939 [Hyaloraphidium curvatum]|nr:hypothetical protein DFJ74DRAFT_388939 [Hyaloraphidium curvatum]
MFKMFNERGNQPYVDIRRVYRGCNHTEEPSHSPERVSDLGARTCGQVFHRMPEAERTVNGRWKASSVRLQSLRPQLWAEASKVANRLRGSTVHAVGYLKPQLDSGLWSRSGSGSMRLRPSSRGITFVGFEMRITCVAEAPGAMVVELAGSICSFNALGTAAWKLMPWISFELEFAKAAFRVTESPASFLDAVSVIFSPSLSNTV